jgi:hypothetical protein
MRMQSKFVVLALAGAVLVGMVTFTHQAQAGSADKVAGAAKVALAKPPGGSSGSRSSSSHYSHNSSSSYRSYPYCYGGYCSSSWGSYCGYCPTYCPTYYTYSVPVVTVIPVYTTYTVYTQVPVTQTIVTQQAVAAPGPGPGPVLPVNNGQ